MRLHDMNEPSERTVSMPFLSESLQWRGVFGEQGLS